MLYLAIICAALVCLLAYREWAGARELRRADLRSEIPLRHLQARIEAERDQAGAERAQAAEERRELYQRIQSPEIAVQEAVRKDRGDRRSARPIAADDDAAYAAREVDRG